MSRWTYDPRREEKGDNRLQKSGVTQSKCAKLVGRKDTEGEGKLNIKKTLENNGVGFSLDIKLAIETKFGAAPDRGWNTTTS